MMHGKQANATKYTAPMIRTHSHRQLSLTEFDWPFQTALDENIRWVKTSQVHPLGCTGRGLLLRPLHDAGSATAQRLTRWLIRAPGRPKICREEAHT